MVETTCPNRHTRWTSEAAFFDAAAMEAAATLTPVDPAVLARYSGRLRRHNAEEFRFRVLGDLRGRRLLDVGCGDGANSVLLARLGAIVTGIDISPGAIAVARRRAALNGVSERCEFICAPLETAPLASGSFDVVWGDAILHHLIPELGAILPRLAATLRPGGTIIFAEPISLDRLLRRLRRLVPPPPRGTPDERPLEAADLETVRRYLPTLRIAPFRLLGRLGRFVIPDFRYEGAAWWRRKTLDGLGAADRVLLSMPFFRSRASIAVLWAAA